MLALGMVLMTRITISAAAKRGFASRPTLYRAIKDGRLTAIMDGDKKTIDLADRVTGQYRPTDH